MPELKQSSVGEWSTDSGTGTWDAEPYTPLEPENIEIDIECKPNQFLTAQQHKIVCIDLPPTTIIREVPMWTISNILIIAVIAAVVFKLMPKLTLFNLFKALWKLIIRPFQRKEKHIKHSWEAAERDTRE